MSRAPLAEADPFGTATLRARVLAAWTASTARFREDANAEEELVRGAYRDRLVVELAQNAADAAARAGQRGRLRLTLRESPTGPVLVAANTGAPLDAAAVESLSTLRASAKRDQQRSAGRFGVGFAAVLAVTDAPRIVSAGGGVRWSAGESRELVAGVPELAAELERRGGHVPVLRLPLPAAGDPAEGYDTAVVLPLRDADAAGIVARLLAAVDPTLLIALPDLAHVEVEADGVLRVLTAEPAEAAAPGAAALIVQDDRVRTRWHVVRRGGALDPALLADRPSEERLRAAWSLTWAVPLRHGAPAPLPHTTPPVAHAPTPTDDELDLPALLIASFPLDSSRRRVAPGPLRDFLVSEAAGAYAELVVQLAGDPKLGPEGGALALVPGPVAAGELDAELRRALLVRLAETPFLPAADAAPGEEGHRRLRPRDAVMIRGADEALVDALAPVLGGLVPAGWAVSSLARLGVRALTIGEVVDSLAGLDREATWWRSLYAALSGAADAESLRGLPVPLADGRLVRGPRGVLLPDAVRAPTLSALGLRVAHPDATHPLLERLGARPAGPAAVLAHPAVQAAAIASWDADEAERETVVEAVLELVAAAGTTPGELPWLAEIPLPDADGELVPAGELLLPGAALAQVLAPDSLGTVHPELVRRVGPRALAAVGVLDSFAIVRDADVPLDRDGCDHDLDAEDGWVAATSDLLARGPRGGARGAGPELVTEFVAVRDLDLVAAEAWPQALRMLATPPLRAAVTEPVRVLRADGRGVDVPAYAAWWLRTHPVLGGRRPADLRWPGSDPRLAGLWDVLAPADGGGLDEAFARALGVRVDLAEVLAAPGGPDDVLDRLTDPARVVDRDCLAAIYAALAAVDPDRVSPRDAVRVPAGSATAVAPAAEATVVDAPDLAPLLAGRPLVPAPPAYAAALADVLGLPLAGEEYAAPVRAPGTVVPVPEAARRVLAGAPAPCPDTYVEHEALVVLGPRGTVEVDWRWAGGVLHAATTEGLGAGLAWAAGDWSRRWVVCAALEAPHRVDELLFADEFARR